MINGTSTLAYIDLGSSCSAIQQVETQRLNLQYDPNSRSALQGYGNGQTFTLGSISFNIVVDEVEAKISAHVVRDVVQDVPVLLGRNFSELPDVIIVKDDVSLKFFKRINHNLNMIEPDLQNSKLVLRVAEESNIIPNHWGHIKVYNNDYEGDGFIEASIRCPEGQEYCIPHTVISLEKGKFSVLPCISLANNIINFKKDKVLARAIRCVPEVQPSERIMKICNKNLEPLPLNDINIGPISDVEKQKLFDILGEY